MLCVVAATPASAQERLHLPRMSTPIVLDGMPDEEAWAEIEALPVVMYQPVYGGEMTEETQIRVAYDDHYVYVSGALLDRQPDAIRANSMYRDGYSGDDTFGILLDTFNDNENALWFFTTPNGTRFDSAVSNDAQSGRGSMNRSWNTYWDVATHRSPKGWFVEIRIPLSSLGFQTNGAETEMGLIVYRYIARRNERHIFPDIRPDWNMAFAKPSLARKVVLSDVTSSRPVYVSPFVVGGLGRRSELNSTEIQYLDDTSVTRDVGIDVKYNLTSNLTLDLTANTDFAQAEADNEEVNLTRFSLFFPEKRQFFQERAGLFDFSLGGSNRVFNSRNIGLDEDGNPVRILGGTRIVGRVGKWDLGIIDMQTDESADLPYENFGVLRVRRRVLNDYSYAGSIVTSRVGSDGGYNFAYGLDGSVRITGDEYLSLQWVQSFDDVAIDESGVTVLPSSAVRAKWERRTSKGLAYSTALTRVGSDFAPDLGFQNRTNYFQPRGSISYGWFSEGNSAFRTISSELQVFAFLDNDDGNVESAAIEYEWDFELISGARLGLDVVFEEEDLDEELELSSNAWIPPGRYRFVGGDARFRMHDGALLRANVELSGGKFYDGTLISVGTSPTWNLSRYVELGGEIELTRLRFPDRNQEFDYAIARLRGQLAFSTKASISAFIQYSSAADFIRANVRFRMNFREGHDLWLVFNQGTNTDRYRGLPTLPVSDSRAVLIKYTHTFAL
ncbi:MAG: carbohydrate binding family 9 domain-containing protein [Rhodothermales bacterium]|nr:carbohydrate binding family 9 domain-containing protein [Rhodothermales bacterium]